MKNVINKRSYYDKKVHRLALVWRYFWCQETIFPPSLGVQSGSNFWPILVKTVLSGVGIAVLTLVIGTHNLKGPFMNFSERKLHLGLLSSI